MSILMTPAYIAATAYPLLHARIGWENLARLAAISASSTDGAEAYLQAPISDQTFEWWQAVNLPAWWAATFSTPQVVNYCGIAAHEIGSAGATVQVQYQTGGVWHDVTDATLTPTDDGAIMILFEDITCDAMRIRITGVSGAPRIGIIHFGRILEMTRPVKWMGHTPARFNRDFDKRPNTSDRGQRLGTSLTRLGISGQFNCDNLDETWVRNTFDNFIVNSMRYGYFISWRPDQFPAEVYFGWTDKPIVPTNSRGGVTRYMAVNWAMDCHAPENVQAWES
jgi:hypothetical protein